MLGFGSYRTAWFMSHRIREAMTGNDVSTGFDRILCAKLY
jgi:hypothetical protein